MEKINHEIYYSYLYFGLGYTDKFMSFYFSVASGLFVKQTSWQTS